MEFPCTLTLIKVDFSHLTYNSLFVKDYMYHAFSPTYGIQWRCISFTLPCSILTRVSSGLNSRL